MPNRVAATARTARSSFTAPGVRSASGAKLALWRPNDNVQTHLVYEADRVRGLLNGAAMPSWVDVSGLGGHASQATGAKQPLYIQSVLNGQPGVGFSTTKGFQIPTLDLTGFGTVYASMVVASSSANDEVILEHSAAASALNGFAVVRLGASGGGAAQLILGGTNGPYMYNSAELITATPKILTVLFDHTLGSAIAVDGAQEAIAWINGTAFGGGDLNNRRNTSNATFAATSLNVGARANATAVPFNGVIGDILLGFGVPTADTIEQMELYLANKYGIDRQIGGANIAAEGDSLMCGFGAGGGAENIPTQGVMHMTTRYRHWNFAVPGQTILNMIAGAPSRYDTKIRTGALNVITIYGGGNDVAQGATWFDVQARLSAWAAARRAAGWNKIGVCTYVPGSNPTFDTIRNLFLNPWVRDGVNRGEWDFVVDLAAEPTAGTDAAGKSVVYYGDGTHPTNLGQELLGQQYTLALKTLGLT